ncbi:hypothetical protein EDD55_101186 [Varunaivibrio sulfuroxidans]|uniref:Transposase n=1 Tax=Varunaivibrio sulfuroxidans TaxID=1773489 RepID=A0A4R3JH76_9PROT|nr:hypothetical protein EDD55_101186 [Varunaivibrio sulfuroxidans]
MTDHFCLTQEKLGRFGPCVAPKKNRVRKIEYDAGLYKQRHETESMSGKLKDWR